MDGANAITVRAPRKGESLILGLSKDNQISKRLIAFMRSRLALSQLAGMINRGKVGGNSEKLDTRRQPARTRSQS